LNLSPRAIGEHWFSMDRLLAQPPAAPSYGPPKPSLELPPTKKLDEALLAILRRRKRDAGIFPGVPFN